MICHYSRIAGIAAAVALLSFSALSAFALTITVESKCVSGGTYVEGGTGWGNSSSKSNKTPCAGGSRSSKDAGAFSDFIPTIVTEGSYDVYLTWGQTTSSNNGPNAENAQVSIIDNAGTSNFTVNMRGHMNCANNADQLIYIGRGYFKPGQGHKVRLSHTATAQCFNGAMRRFVSADAAIFEFLAPVPTIESTWSGVKARYRS